MMCFQYNGGNKRCINGRFQEKINGKWVDVKGEQQIKQAIQEIDDNQNEEQFQIKNQGEQQQKQFQQDQKQQIEDLKQEQQPQSKEDSS